LLAPVGGTEPGGENGAADEMSHAWIAISHLDDETYEELLAQRESQQQSQRAAD